MDTTSQWIRRDHAAPGLAIFVHGFCGESQSTWSDFPKLVPLDPDLREYDFCFWGYPTNLNPLNIIKKFFWSDVPNLDTLGAGLRTLLTNAAQNYQKIILAGHSMGGLIIQLFILEELSRKSRTHLDRLTEVVLYGTPSDGLIKASLVRLLNTQAADMGWFSGLILDLRYQWKRLIDADRATTPPPFRLTLVAGMEDKFVPESSSLNPFPFDEKEIVPGTHTQMVKPRSPEDLAYRVLKNRMLRKTPTALERELIEGVAANAIALMARVSAAAQLGDIDTLVADATELLKKPASLPKVERALGLALLDAEVYSESSQLLKRYVDFKMPDSDLRPFRNDSQALQQLAIAQSGAGQILEAVASLETMDPELRSDPETLGILGGRFKRQWLKTGSNAPLARRSLALYESALAKARNQRRPDQIFYNGVNVAYLRFALREGDYSEMAAEVLEIVSKEKPDYWSEATRGECLLLLSRYPEALAAYQSARRLVQAPRHWTSTGQQALDILERQGRPDAGTQIADLFRGVRQDFAAR